jgi:hypothetical protein
MIIDVVAENKKPYEFENSQALLPVCSCCEKVRINGYWYEDVDLLLKYQDRLTHGICPECISRLYPQFAKKILAAECPS